MTFTRWSMHEWCKGCTNFLCQMAMVTKLCTVTSVLWVLSVELASCYIFGTKNFEMAAFWKVFAPLVKCNMVPSWNDCRHINAALHSCCIVNPDTAVSNTELLSIAEEVKHWVLFVLLSSYKICCTAFSSINICRYSCKVFFVSF